MYELAQVPVSLAAWAGIRGVGSVLIQVFAGLEKLKVRGSGRVVGMVFLESGSR